MDRKGKGKQIAGTKSSPSAGKKRKVGGVEFRDEGLRTSKRRNPEVLQFFEESAEIGYYGESSDEEIDNFLNDMEEDEPEVEASGKDDKGKKSKSSYVFPKEEEINEDEYDRIMEERYKPGSGFVRYAEDDVKDSIEMDTLAPTKKDPPIWKVKCAIGREKHSVFCLMHKFAELRKIGNKLQILSVFFVEHVKGFIFIEADKEHDVLEACKSLTGIYATRMMLLPNAEAPHLLTVQRKTKTSSEGKWARVKSGIYKGDLAEVVAVSDPRRKALIKLIPRIDMQALTQKYGGGVAVKKSPTPAPRLISSSELEEFRPLIQVRRDRDTGMTFEHIDSLMLKDGYLYKKVSLDSLSSWGVIPTKEEILKFTPVEQKETDDVEWISEIYGEEKKKKVLPTGKGGGKGEASVGEKGEGSSGGKGEGSSGSKSESSYELYNLVCFSRKDFGLIVGVDDKGDGYKVLKEGSDGPVVVTVGKKEIMKGPFDSKFTALDLNNKQISINDVVKISKGPSEGKQGVVRQVYRGIIFLYDESEEENGGYFCCKSQSCEKIKLFPEESSEKTGGFDASAFGDSVSSPKSPLSPEKEWQPKEKYINSSQGEKGSMYSIGQKLRIRVGPLKGYLCRVIALRYSDVTVKLDSQHKIFTVKSEHLAEVRDRNTVLSTSGDAGTGSFQPFDMLGTEGSSGDWAKGAGTSGEGGNWNTGGAATDLGAWGSKPTADVSSQQPTVPDDNTSAWGNAAAENKPASDWNSWGKTSASEAGTAGGWGDAGASKVETSSWGKQGASTSNVEYLGSWGKHGGSSDGNKQDEDSLWGKLVQDSESKKEESSWGKKVGSESGFGKGGGESSWANKDGNSNASNKEGVSWGQQDKGSDGSNGGSAWGNQGGRFGSGEKKDASSGWNKSAEDSNANNKGLPCWGKADGGSSWGQQDKGGSSQVEPDGGSSWGKKDDGNKDDGGSGWGKKDDGGSGWGKKDDGGSSWGKKDDSNKDDGGSSWGKKDDSNKDDGGSSWGKKNDGNKDDEGSTWGKKDLHGVKRMTVIRMMEDQHGVKRLMEDLLGPKRMMEDPLGAKRTMEDRRGVRRMMEGTRNILLIGEDVGLVGEEEEVAEVAGISLGGADPLVILRIPLHGVNQVADLAGGTKTAVGVVQAGVNRMMLVVDLAGANKKAVWAVQAGVSRTILVVDRAGGSKTAVGAVQAGVNRMVVVVLPGVSRMIVVVDRAGASKIVVGVVQAGVNRMVVVAVVLPGVSRMIVVVDRDGASRMTLVVDQAGASKTVAGVVQAGVNRTMVVVVDRAGPNRVMAFLNRGVNRVVVVGLVEEEEGDSEEVSVEVETKEVEMEEGRLIVINHLRGKQTIKKTIGRATKVVDRTGKKVGERIQTIESHLIHPLVGETGLAGVLTQRKKLMLVITIREMKTNQQLGEPVMIRRIPETGLAGALTQRKKLMLVMTNREMKTNQQLGEPVMIRRIPVTTMTVGTKSQTMMSKQVEMPMLHGAVNQTQERRHQVARRGEREPETKNPDGKKMP